MLYKSILAWKRLLSVATVYCVYSWNIAVFHSCRAWFLFFFPINDLRHPLHDLTHKPTTQIHKKEKWIVAVREVDGRAAGKQGVMEWGSGMFFIHKLMWSSVLQAVASDIASFQTSRSPWHHVSHWCLAHGVTNRTDQYPFVKLTENLLCRFTKGHISFHFWECVCTLVVADSGHESAE